VLTVLQLCVSIALSIFSSRAILQVISELNEYFSTTWQISELLVNDDILLTWKNYNILFSVTVSIHNCEFTLCAKLEYPIKKIKKFWIKHWFHIFIYFHQTQHKFYEFKIRNVLMSTFNRLAFEVDWCFIIVIVEQTEKAKWDSIQQSNVYMFVIHCLCLCSFSTKCYQNDYMEQKLLLFLNNKYFCYPNSACFEQKY